MSANTQSPNGSPPPDSVLYFGEEDGFTIPKRCQFSPYQQFVLRELEECKDIIQNNIEAITVEVQSQDFHDRLDRIQRRVAIAGRAQIVFIGDDEDGDEDENEDEYKSEDDEKEKYVDADDMSEQEIKDWQDAGGVCLIVSPKDSIKEIHANLVEAMFHAYVDCTRQSAAYLREDSREAADQCPGSKLLHFKKLSDGNVLAHVACAAMIGNLEEDDTDIEKGLLPTRPTETYILTPEQFAQLRDNRCRVLGGMIQYVSTRSQRA
jgi:hypothetical protein